MSRSIGPLGTLIPFLPVVVGLFVSAWRFRADDAVGGLASGLSGFVLLIVIAVLMDRRSSG